MSKQKRMRTDPAPAEIKRLCAEIRTMWSDMTYKVRAGYGKNFDAVAKFEAWLPPTVSTLELDELREAS
ncbi:MAG: hypothetical protein KDB14_27805 [Planctomycetales bacterium]|nr:hypothetical protein [Planctomycetales bacterium]